MMKILAVSLLAGVLAIAQSAEARKISSPNNGERRGFCDALSAGLEKKTGLSVAKVEGPRYFFALDELMDSFVLYCAADLTAEFDSIELLSRELPDLLRMANKLGANDHAEIRKCLDQSKVTLKPVLMAGGECQYRGYLLKLKYKPNVTVN
jgi:hypothetical protein